MYDKLNQSPENNSEDEPFILAIEKCKLEVHSCLFGIAPWDEIFFRLLKYLLTSHALILEISLKFLVCQ
jgi:hypothetical protein